MQWTQPVVCVLLHITVCSATVQWDDEFMQDNVPIREKRDMSHFEDRKIRIVTILYEPFTMKKDDGSFYGFIPELINKISRRLNFDYQFYLETQYGSYDQKTGEWNGLIGEVIKNKNDTSQGADIAAAALVITSAREMYVDFVKPFLNLGLSIVIKKPYWDIQRMVWQADAFDSPYDFNILSPLAPEVWGVVIICIVAVSLLLWATNKFNPYEWEGRYQLGLADKHQAEIFSLQGSVWFVFTSLQWQAGVFTGFERAPRSIGGKVLTAFWFMFVTIFLVTYTAGIVNNLFWASLVHNQDPLRSNIHNLEELVNDPSFEWGTVRGGAVESYLKYVAQGAEFQQMRDYMDSENGNANMVNTVEEGLQKVRQGRYAFIMESLNAKFQVNHKPCDIMIVGEQFAQRSYGMAVPHKSPLLEDLHKIMLELQEEGDLETLEQKWFVGNVGECWNITRMEQHARRKVDSVEIKKPKHVNLAMYWPPLIFIIMGIVVSAITSFSEIIWYKFRGRYKDSNRPQGQVLKIDNEEVSSSQQTTGPDRQ